MGNVLQRQLVAVTVLLGLLAILARPVAAQQIALTSAEMSVAFTYGNSVVFEVKASAESMLTSARLTVQIDSRDSLYSEVVPITHGTTVEIAHTVVVSNLDLPPFAGVSYYWDFQDGAGQQYRTDTQHFRYEDTSVPWTWTIVSQGNILVYTDGQDETVSRAALDVARSAVTQTEQMLGVSFQDQLHIYVYPDLAAMASCLRLHHLRVQDWVAAYAIPDQNVVLISATSGPDLLVNLRRDLPHEITHVVVENAAGPGRENLPGWFTEGLALTMSAEPDATLATVLEDAARREAFLPIETLCVQSYGGFVPQEAALAYAQSGGLVRYIIDRYGASQVRALLAAYSEGLSCDGAVRQALGISLTELHGQWHNDLLGDVARAPHQDTSLAPWVAAWFVSMGLALLFIAPQPSVDTSRTLSEDGVNLPYADEKEREQG